MSESYTAYPLTSLVPATAFELAYAIPLLLLSTLITFSGTFFTLDRTRSFAPAYNTTPGSYKQSDKFRLPIEGGIGGIVIGYALGVHLSTFFALFVPSISTSKPLSSTAFLVVWLLSSVCTALLAGRWKYCALGFAGLSGGVIFTLAVCVMIHPAWLTRIIFTCIITPILTLFTVLPMPRFQHGAMRWATAATGAGGLTISIALLANIPAWYNVWERLWLEDGINWGTSKEKALTAAYFLFFSVGVLCDIFLRRQLGECPDEKWDSYLAKYTTNLPDRAGVFKPPTSAWGRLFSPAHDSKDIVFPDDHDSKLDPTDPLSPSYEFQAPKKGLKKSRSKGVFGAGKRSVVKFRPLADLEMMSSDSEGDDDPLKSPPPGKPWLAKKPSVSSTAATLVSDTDSKTPTSKDGKDGKVDKIDYDEDIKKLVAGKKGFGEGEVPEYSDYEDDIATAHKNKGQSDGKESDWSPGFMKGKKRSTTSGMASSAATAVGNDPPPGAVPATPSLIKALDRIAVAQKDAFTSSSPQPSGLPPVSEDRPQGADAGASGGGGGRWTDFWRDVNRKAAAGGDAASRPS